MQLSVFFTTLLVAFLARCALGQVIIGTPALTYQGYNNVAQFLTDDPTDQEDFESWGSDIADSDSPFFGQVVTNLSQIAGFSFYLDSTTIGDSFSALVYEWNIANSTLVGAPVVAGNFTIGHQSGESLLSFTSKANEADSLFNCTKVSALFAAPVALTASKNYALIFQAINTGDYGFCATTDDIFSGSIYNNNATDTTGWVFQDDVFIFEVLFVNITIAPNVTTSTTAAATTTTTTAATTAATTTTTTTAAATTTTTTTTTDAATTTTTSSSSTSAAPATTTTTASPLATTSGGSGVVFSLTILLGFVFALLL